MKPKAEAKQRARLLTSLDGHLHKALARLRELELPEYPTGGPIGIAHACAIGKALASAREECRGLTNQLAVNQSKQNETK